VAVGTGDSNCDKHQHKSAFLHYEQPTGNSKVPDNVPNVQEQIINKEGSKQDPNLL